LTGTRLGIVVLISGRGSNLQSIIDAVDREQLPVDIKAVISNRADAYGLQRAAQAGIVTRVVDHTAYADRTGFDRALQACIDEYQPALVALAGFMRILTPEFVEHYQGRLMNIHPALLPAFPGLNTHQRALDAGVAEHGASVHFVTREVDGGPVIVQARVEVRPDDTDEILAARVLEQEHCIYPLAIQLFAEGRVKLDGDTVILDGNPLPRSGIDYHEFIRRKD
jgi:phosphoribosylglycinamide formyltransferase-1